MSDKEVDINGKTYGENTKITLSAKTLLWVIGIIVVSICSLATIGYFDIKDRVNALDESYNDKVENTIEEVMKEDREKRESIIETIGEMKGDIKVILDRTSRNNDNKNNNGRINNIPNSMNVPDNLPGAGNRDDDRDVNGTGLIGN